MESARRFSLELGGKIYDLNEAEFFGVLFNLVTALVFEKRADRATYLLEVGEFELSGSGSVHFDPICVSLYRHLKEEPCQGPAYPELKGKARSFRVHSLVDALEAVAFFLKAGETVPHFFLGSAERDVLTVRDRGAHTRVLLDDPKLVKKLCGSMPETSAA